MLECAEARIDGPGPAVADVASLVAWAVDQAEAVPGRRARMWGEEEDAFLEENLGFLSEAAIAAALGRTVNAVRIRWKRELRLPAPTKTPGYVTANKVAKIMGVDGHSVCRWIERGWLRAHELPFRERHVWRVRDEDLKRFAVNPERWMLFRVEDVRDLHIARLVTLAQRRWGDRWLRPGEVGAMHGVDDRRVNRYVHEGKVAGAIKWGNWWIRQSVAEGLHFRRGRRGDCRLTWSPEGDAFMVLARAVGMSQGAIGRAMAIPRPRAAYRLARLHRDGKIPTLMENQRLEGMTYRAGDGRLLADWREHERRFPALARAVKRFERGQKLSPGQAEMVRGVLWAWAAFHLGRDDHLTRRLQVVGGNGVCVGRLEGLCDELAAAGIRPVRRGAGRAAWKRVEARGDAVWAREAAAMLGVGFDTVTRLLKRGWLRARGSRCRNRTRWWVRVSDLERFVTKPESWLVLDAGRMGDRRLTRLMAVAQERWPDEWLSGRQAGELLGRSVSAVSWLIRSGKLPGVKWRNWRVRQSDVERLAGRTRAGRRDVLEWSEAGDAFTILARAVGLSRAAVARLMKCPVSRVEHRLRVLHRRGETGRLIEEYGLKDVEYRECDGRLLADWQAYGARFPALARAMERFRAGQPLSAGEIEGVRGVLWAWAVFYLGVEHPAARRAQSIGGRGDRYGPLRAAYLAVKEAGIDPIEGRQTTWEV